MKGIVYQYKINAKYYVGKTFGLERKRKDKHRYEAFTLQKQTPFAKAIRKYGWDMVVSGYSVIETIEADTKDELNRLLIEREAFWIRERNSIAPNGYNVMASGSISPPHTYNKEEIYKRVSQSLKGKYMNCPATSRPVYCIELKRWYPSISEAERQHNIAGSGVEKAASGKNVSAGGFHWSYEETDTYRADLIKQSRKPVYCVETGTQYPSVYAVAKELFGEQANSKKSLVQNALRHNRKTCGLTFRYVNPVLSETEV